MILDPPIDEQADVTPVARQETRRARRDLPGRGGTKAANKIGRIIQEVIESRASSEDSEGGKNRFQEVLRTIMGGAGRGQRKTSEKTSVFYGKGTKLRGAPASTGKARPREKVPGGLEKFRPSLFREKIGKGREILIGGYNA